MNLGLSSAPTPMLSLLVMSWACLAPGFQVKAVLDDILEKIPETFNMAEIMAKAAEKTPYVVVAFQECERMNILTNEMRRSLKELNLGLKVKTASALRGRFRSPVWLMETV